MLPAAPLSGRTTPENMLADQAYQQVVRTLERDIVPRLMLVRHEPGRSRDAPRATAKPPGDVQVEEFVRLLQSRDATLAAAYVQTLRQRGVQPHTLCLHLLAPAAARLGVLWEEDACSFMQVTLALSRLHQLLYGLCSGSLPDQHGDDPVTGASRALLVGLPGEQHTFGVLVAGYLLRHAGWDVWNEFPENADEMLQVVKRLSFRIVGISVGTERQLKSLPPLISAIRRHSRHRNVSVVLGGALVSRHPGLARRLGADAAPVDADEMLQWAENQLAVRGRGAREG